MKPLSRCHLFFLPALVAVFLTAPARADVPGEQGGAVSGCGVTQTCSGPGLPGTGPDSNLCVSNGAGSPCGSAAGPASQPASTTGQNVGVGNPLNVLSGNKYQEEVDLPPLPGVLGLEIVRHYNSQYARPNVPSGIFGRGWKLSYETELYVVKTTVQIVQADGTRIIFDRDARDPSVCATRDPGRGRVLIRATPRGDEYVWIWPDGRRLYFDAGRRLTQIVAPTGEFVALTRDASGALVKVTDPQGRSLVLSYGTKAEAGFRGVRFIDAPVGRFAYAYGSEPAAGAEARGAARAATNLASVTLPGRYAAEEKAHPWANRGATQGGVTRHYHYESARHPTLLTGISVTGSGSDGVPMQTRLITWDYDEEARAILSLKGERPGPGKGPGPEEVRLAYPARGTTELTNSAGRKTTYRWAQIAGDLRLLEAIGPGCASCGPTNVRHGYDAQGRLMVSTRLDAQGRPLEATRWTRDAAGRVAREARYRFVRGKVVPAGWVRFDYAPAPAGNAARAADAETLALPDPKPVRILRPSGVAGKTHEVTLAYNAAGQILSVTETGFAPALPEAGPRAEPTPLRRTTTYGYTTRNGRSLLQHIDGPLPNGPAGDPSDSDITRLDWDARGDFITAVTAPGSMTTTLARDEAGRVSTQTLNDGWRQVTRTMTYSPHGELERLTLAADGDPAAQASPDAPRLPPIERQPIQFRYDALGALSHVIGSDGTAWRQTYDPQTRTRTLTTPTGELLHRYDGEGRLQAWLVRDPQGNVHGGGLNLWHADGQLAAQLGPLGEITAHARTTGPVPLHGVLDAAGRATWSAAPDDGRRHLLSPDGSARQLRVGENGTAVRDAAGRAYHLWRDDFGRPVRELAPDEGLLDYTYTDHGIIKRQRGKHGETLVETLRLDPQGRLIERTRGECTERLYYAGALLARIEGCGNAHTFARDAFGLIVRHTQRIDTAPGDGRLDFDTQYAYRPADGRLRARTLPDGQRLHYRYAEASGRIERIARERGWLNAARRLLPALAERLHGALPAALTEEALLSDLAYRPFGAATHFTQANGAATASRLDAAGRVTELTVTHAGTRLLDVSYAWSGPQRLAAATRDAERRVFTHDALGRLTAERAAGTLLWRTAYTPLGERREAPPVRDGFGRRAERQGLVLTYDAAHRLSALSRHGETVATYTYDALGNRLSKTVAGKTTRFLYDLQHRLVAEADADGTLQAQYLYAGHWPYAVLKGDGSGGQTREVYAVHADPRGLPLAVSDKDGRLVWRGDFDAFGNERAQTPPAGTGFAMPLRLAGQYFDAESGLHYNVHRYYDPARGEYLTPDPLGLVDADNRYAYARGNPLTNIDPLGLFKIPELAFVSPPALISGISLDVQDGGHGDILRIAFAQYNRENGNRFSQTIIDQIIRNNYWTDALAGGQFNPSNHWDNPNDGPMYSSEGGGKTASYADGSGDLWLQDALTLLNTNRGYYQNTTAVQVPKPGSVNGVDISTILAAFGQNSHLLADFYAHTNWVDSDCRGGKVKNTALLGSDETGWIPVGMGQATVWNETISDKLFSGTVGLLPSTSCPIGDVFCTEDKTTHGYWNKDSEKTQGGKEEYTGSKMYSWEVQIYDPSAPKNKKGNPDPNKFGTEWYADYGVPQPSLKPGDRIYVRVEIEDKFQLAFQLAIEHTKQEIAKLYDGAVGIEVNGQKLTDIFAMDRAQLFQNDVAYTTPSLRQ